MPEEERGAPRPRSSAPYRGAWAQLTGNDYVLRADRTGHTTSYTHEPMTDRLRREMADNVHGVDVRAGAVYFDPEVHAEWGVRQVVYRVKEDTPTSSSYELMGRSKRLSAMLSAETLERRHQGNTEVIHAVQPPAMGVIISDVEPGLFETGGEFMSMGGTAQRIGNDTYRVEDGVYRVHRDGRDVVDVVAGGEVRAVFDTNEAKRETTAMREAESIALYRRTSPLAFGPQLNADRALKGAGHGGAAEVARRGGVSPGLQPLGTGEADKRASGQRSATPRHIGRASVPGQGSDGAPGGGGRS